MEKYKGTDTCNLIHSESVIKTLVYFPPYFILYIYIPFSDKAG